MRAWIWKSASLVVLFALLWPLGSAGPLRAQPSELVFLQMAEASSLDHLRDFTVAALGIHGHIYDPLLDLEGADFEQVPKLAVSWRNVNPTTWRFNLRRGVKFHNGQELTSEDVKYSLEWAADNPRSVKRSQAATLARVTAVDRYTIEITTRQPDAALLSRLGFLYIVNKATHERDPDAFGRAPVGTGRFKVARWERDQQLVLERFDEYWGAKPRVARLVVRTVREPAARVAELQRGRAHIIQGLPVEMAADIGRSPEIQVIVAKGVRQVYYPLNSLKPPFDDYRVRQAANHAVDRQAIVRSVMEGYGEVRTGPFSPKQWGFDDRVREYTYDPARARQLMTEAGYSQGVDVTWDVVPAIVKGVEIAEAAANMLRQVGIRVRVNVVDSGRWFERYTVSGAFDITYTTWSRQADPDSIISGLRIYSPVSKWFNHGGVDRLIEEGRATFDPARRLAIYKQLHRTLVETSPWLYIHAQDEVFAARKDVNWSPFPFGGNAGMTYFIPLK